MSYRSVGPRAHSPAHQQLYKAHSESAPRRPSSVTPTRNSFALAVAPRGQSPRAGARSNGSAAPRADGMVYVADVNPVYSVTAAVRCIVPINERVMWTAEYSGTLCVRALPKGTPLKELPGRENSYCIALLYLPEEDVVWAGFQDGYLHVYSARNMDLLAEVMAHSGGLNCMTEVEGAVFTGGADWKVCQWDPAEGNAQLHRILHGHRGGVRALGVYDGPTGAVLFSGSDDGTVRAWDPYESSPGNNNNADANIHTFTGHSRAVLSLCVVSHANQLWSAGEDLTIRVWDLRSLACLGVLRGIHTAPIANLMVVESRMWSADKHGHIVLWDITTRTLLQDLAERVPMWGTGQGMVLAMQKVQPMTAYKVWTASSNGVLQCWNAETVPIIFDDVPVSVGTVKAAGTLTNAITAGASDATSGQTGASAARGGSGGNGADAVTSSALTVASASNDGYSSSQAGAEPQSGSMAGPMARMQDFIRSLQEELEATKRDAKLNYEKYRLEVQREIETQQLLAQENDRLRAQLREAEERLGEGAAATPAPARPSSVQRSGLVQPASRGASHPNMEDEIERLQNELIDAQRHLDEALERQHELEGELDRHKLAASSSVHALNVSAPAAPESTAPDPSRQFMRQDDVAKLASTADYARGDSHGSSVPRSIAPSGLTAGAAAAPTYLASGSSALLPASTGPDEGDSGSYAGVPVEHTRLSRRFPGGNWAHIVSEKPHELRSTFIADICAGLGVAPTQLERVDLGLAGSLVTEVDVVHPASVPASELERRMHTYRFPALMRLHTVAYTAPKSAPDAAVATAAELQQQLVDERQQQRRPHSPDPQQPRSNSVSNRSDGALNPIERQRLKEQNDTLRDTLQRQLKLINDLKDDANTREGQLAETRERLRDAETRVHELQQAERERTPSASRPFTSTEVQTEDVGSRAPPRVDGTVRKPDASASGRPTELIAVPLSGDMAAAAAAQDGSTDAEDYVALQSYLQEQLKPMISRLKRARGELQFDKDELSKKVESLTAQMEQLQQQLQAATSTPAPAPAPPQPRTPAAADASGAEVEKLRDDHAALKRYQDEQLKPTISRLERARDELQVDNNKLKKRVEELEKEGRTPAAAPDRAAAAEQEQQAAAPAVHQRRVADELQPASAELQREGGAVAAERDALQQQLEALQRQQAAADPQLQELRDDHEALNSYLQDQLKPMIARLKRARGELQLDKDRLTERLASLSANGAAGQAGEADELDPPPLTQPPAALNGSAHAAEAEAKDEDENVHQMREDFAALNNYLQDQLKPMISRLKRARGELQLDLSRAREDLQRACDMYDEATAALEEARVREEKMGEAMETLQKALEAEQARAQAAEDQDANGTSNAAAARQPSEGLSGRPTEPTPMHGRDDAAAAAGGGVVAVPQNGEHGDADSLDKLVALNLDLSVRLADAEAVIAQLHDSLDHSSSQLKEQREETQRLLGKIQQYQRSAPRPSTNPSRGVSERE